MARIRLLVLDILKPHQPSIIELATAISDIEGVHGADVTVYEIDSKVENVKATIVGEYIDFEKIKKVIDEMGGTIHSIDKVGSGEKLIEEVFTHQDSSA